MLRWVEEASGAFLKIQFNNILSPVYVYVLPRISPTYVLTLESVCPPRLRHQTFRLLHESHVPVFLFIGINVGQETVGYCLWKYIFPAECIDQEMDSSPHFIASMSLYGCAVWSLAVVVVTCTGQTGRRHKIQNPGAPFMSPHGRPFGGPFWGLFGARLGVHSKVRPPDREVEAQQPQNVMWRNFKFLYLTDVEITEIPPHVESL